MSKRIPVLDPVAKTCTVPISKITPRGEGFLSTKASSSHVPMNFKGDPDQTERRITCCAVHYTRVQYRSLRDTNATSGIQCTPPSHPKTHKRNTCIMHDRERQNATNKETHGHLELSGADHEITTHRTRRRHQVLCKSKTEDIFVC